ncbi:MAG: helix-turn-helix domain-containing protein [Actinomycetota bacterium]|nr:helix-turn-helix domain-containing protein [Actinomycetota bacterium]
MSEKLAIEVPDAFVEVIAARAAAIVLAELREDSGGRWLTGAQACADYLGFSSARRVYNRLPEIPHARDGARLLFNTADLDAWLRGSQ